jgi:hypothetical protein
MTERSRDEHVAWCKQRAREYLDRGDVANGVTSMWSDMNKHPECQVQPALALIAMKTIIDNDIAEARRFVEGFR